MKKLDNGTFFFDGSEAGSVDTVLQGYRTMGYEISVYQYHSSYKGKKGVAITEVAPLKSLMVECYTNTLFS